MEASLLNVIIIAKRNTSMSFLRALRSVLEQTYSPIKVLVVDANEPDSMYSLGLLEDLASYPGVDYLRLDQSLSLSKIRNYVINYVEGDYIAFLNSNDKWDSLKVFLQMEQLTQNKDAGASCCNGVLINERMGMAVSPLTEYMTFDSKKWIIDNPARMSSQVIYRLDMVKAIGGFDESFVNFSDGDILLRLNKLHKVLLLPLSLCECHIPPDYEEYDYQCFRDGQKILDKYREYFLLNKSMTLTFYTGMLHLAKINYLWLNFCSFLILYFMKAPGRSVILLTHKLFQMLSYMLKWSFWKLSLQKEAVGIQNDLRLMKKGKSRKEKASNPVNLPEAEEAMPVISFARCYNVQKALNFAFNHTLKSIVIPDYVIAIKEGMFYDCNQLVSIEIPNTVLEIQANAFRNCKNLRRIIFQEGSRLTKIGAYAFAGCSSLETISFPNTLTQLGKFAFYDCKSLQHLSFTYIHKGELMTSNIFPANIALIPRYAFAGCSSLLSVEFGINSMLNSVERGAFIGCGRLQKLLLSGRIRSLDNYAFAYCRKLETAAIPQIDNLRSIGKGAFLYCEALVYFQISNQMNRINIRTFYGCASLKQIKIPKKVLSINHQAFAKCTSLDKAIILTGDIAIAPSAFDKHTKVKIIDGEDNNNFDE